MGLRQTNTIDKLETPKQPNSKKPIWGGKTKKKQKATVTCENQKLPSLSLCRGVNIRSRHREVRIRIRMKKTSVFFFFFFFCHPPYSPTELDPEPSLKRVLATLLQNSRVFPTYRPRRFSFFFVIYFASVVVICFTIFFGNI